MHSRSPDVRGVPSGAPAGARFGWAPAARYAERLIAMRAGDIVASATPAEVVTEPLLAEVFGLSARVIPDPVGASPLVVPLGVYAPAR